MNTHPRIKEDEFDTPDKKKILIKKIIAASDDVGLSVEATLNVLFVCAANLVVRVNSERLDYIPVRAFRHVLESIRKQFKKSQEAEKNG